MTAGVVAAKPEERQARRKRPPALEQEWLTLPQVAALYGVTPQRAGQMVAQGKIQAVRCGTRRRVSRKWLDAQHELGGAAPRSSEGWLLREPPGGLSGVGEETLIRVVEAAVRRVLADTYGLVARAKTAPPADEISERRSERRGRR
jgi:excisionase family DNA binding protein